LALGVDTSEPLGGVALYDGHDLAEERWMDRSLEHAERLLPLMEEILRDHGVERDRLKLVCINRGPGSFTGLRIGLAAAMGLCQAVGAALIGVDGTEVYRSRIEQKRICVIVSSRRALYYVRSYSGSRPRAPVRLMREEDLLESLRGETREVTLVGSGASAIGAALRGHPMIRVAPEEANRPSPLSIAKLGWSEEPADRLYEIEPLYVEPLLVKRRGTTR